MPRLKNPKHEHFAQLVARGQSNREAYAAAYGVEPTVANGASGARAARRPDVAARIDELTEREARKYDVTVGSLTQRYTDLYEIAVQQQDVTAGRGCLDSLAKLHGLLVERKEVQGEVRHIGELHLQALKQLMGESRRAVPDGGLLIDQRLEDDEPP